MTGLRLAFLASLVAAACAPEGPRAERFQPTIVTPAPPRIASDLVYLNVRVGTTRLLRPVAMPEAKRLEDITLPPFAYVAPDSSHALLPLSVREDPPNAPARLRGETERWRTYLDRVDLRTAARALRIDAGAVEVPIGEARRGPLLATPTQVAGALVLVRREDAPAPTARLERFDARTGSLFTARTVPLDDLVGNSPLALATTLVVRPVGGDAALLVRRVFFGGRRRTDWSLLGTDFAQLATLVKASSVGSGENDPAGIAWTHWCWVDVQAVPGRDAWATLCEDENANRSILVVEASTLRELAVIALPDTARMGRSTAWRVRPDASLAVITDKAAVIRVDLDARRVLDARVAVAAGSFPFDEYPVAGYDIPNVALIGANGRFAYVSQMDPQTRRFLTSIRIDSARVVATQLTGLDVRGMQTSTDGARLYVLAADAKSGNDGPTWLYMLDARTLGVLAKSELLEPAPTAIAAVATR